MTIDTKNIQGITVISPKGKITIGAGDVMLRQKVMELLDDNIKDIVADLSGVTMIDSSGIGELVSDYTMVTNRGGRFKLCSLTSQIADILQVTQLITVFEVFDTVEEAVNSF